MNDPAIVAEIIRDQIRHESKASPKSIDLVVAVLTKAVDYVIPHPGKPPDVYEIEEWYTYAKHLSIRRKFLAVLHELSKLELN